MSGRHRLGAHPRSLRTRHAIVVGRYGRPSTRWLRQTPPTRARSHRGKTQGPRLGRSAAASCTATTRSAGPTDGVRCRCHAGSRRRPTPSACRPGRRPGTSPGRGDCQAGTEGFLTSHPTPRPPVLVGTDHEPAVMRRGEAPDRAGWAGQGMAGDLHGKVPGLDLVRAVGTAERAPAGSARSCRAHGGYLGVQVAAWVRRPNRDGPTPGHARRRRCGSAPAVARGWFRPADEPEASRAEPIRAHPLAVIHFGGRRQLTDDSWVALDHQRPGPACGGGLVPWRSACQASGSRTGSQIKRPTGSQGPRHHTVAMCRVVPPW